MLVLKRKVGQKIRVGDDIVIMVTSVTGKQVKIGITAPQELTIAREELPPKKPKPQQAAG